MLGSQTRKVVSKVTAPLARILITLGISANVMTIIGMILTISAAVWFFPHNNLFYGTLVIWFFVMFDMLDGAIARQNGKITVFGAILDSTCDRLADGAIFASLAYWAAVKAHDELLLVNLLTLGVLAQAISYIKARAEASNIPVTGGLMERTERLIVILVGSGFEGLGIPYALWVSSVILLIGSIITFFQRMHIVHLVAGKTSPEVAEIPSEQWGSGGDATAHTPSLSDHRATSNIIAYDA